MRTAALVLAAALLTLTAAHVGADPAPVRLPVERHAFPAIGQPMPASPLPDLGLPGGRGNLGFGNLVWHGGEVQHAPKVYLVFWGWHGVDPSGAAAYLTSFFGGVGGSAWLGSQTQYTDGSGAVGNPTGQLAGVWYDDTSPLAPSPDLGLTDSGLGVELEAIAAAAHFGYDVNADYIIATPSGHSTAGFAANGGPYCAWHSWTGVDTGVHGVLPIAYTNLPYQTDAGASCGKNFVNAGAAGNLDGFSIVAGHEHAEVITDPHLDAWYDVTGYENADKCAWNLGPGATAGNLVIGGSNYAVQALWSNSASACA
jgi:serine protease